MTLKRSNEKLFFKGQVLENFDNFFGLKDSTWAPFEQTKTVLRTF